ncbi:MAG: zinc ABC transporter substrate-binding protein [Ignavibacteriales bacterium]|nr:zinc ABC transporter substrate-binding protein [Ignavibacteriales bacterium]
MKLKIYALNILLIVFSIKLIAGDKIKVVTTLPDLRSIVEEIGGTKVEAFSIATGFQNPHFVDPKPSYILKLTKADMFVTVGLDLETGWSPSLLSSSRNNKIQKGSNGYVDASKNIPLLQIPNDANRSSGDIHMYGNPHYWLDPVRGIKIGRTICEALIKISPDNSNYFEANYVAFKNKSDSKIKEWSALMMPYKGTKIIAYHNEWPYFEDRFGLRIVDFLEPKPGIPPTPGQLSKVINEIKEQNIKVIITSPYFTTESAELIARQTGAKVVVLATSVGADKSINNYFDLFDYNIKKLIDALK